QSALSIQNPSHTGPRTHGDDRFRIHGMAVPISSTAAGEESSAIRALLNAPFGGALSVICQANTLFELHVNAATSGVHGNSALCRGNADYHTGLVRHDGASFPSAQSHAPRAGATHVIMTGEILKMLQVENLTVSRRAGR